MKKKGRWKKIFLLVSVFLLYICVFPMKAEASTIFRSPYVSFSPDGAYWTVREELPYTDVYFNYWESGDYPEYWYEEGTTRSTGIVSILRSLKKGEHYYEWKRVGEIPVGKWVVEHEHGKCVHDSAEGISFGYENVPEKCYHAYYSGWIAYCADCGEIIRPVLMYMSKDAVASIDSINTNYGYYYVCPTNGHIETNLGPGPHSCREISYNKYRVTYKKNVVNVNEVGGEMTDSFHMYDNANIYEGIEVTPQTTLNLNNYSRIGYAFVGWNTKPDGSGTFYEDGAEILNLSVYDYDEDNDRGTVTLYAQWRRAESTLHIDPNGGTYDGSSDVTTFTQGYGTTYLADPEKVTVPDAYTVSFESNGGSALEPIKGTTHFNSWMLSEPFDGRHRNNMYAFLGADGVEDTLTAYYEADAIVLPSTSKAGWSFGGWYYDAEFTKPAGGAGDSIVPWADTVLYAQWVDLVLASKDNYTVNGGKGAVDLTWTQLDKNNKSYLVYQSLDGKSWTKVNNVNDISNATSISQPYIFTGKSGTFTVPYTGIYNLTAYGAQGEGYGKYAGGLGGGVIAKVWLSQGEIITINIGGINGYNGGGAASAYGNGGGATTVVSNRRGTILVAAGGGGATSLAAGGAGGLHTSLRADKVSTGASGGAGGGGGYVGGNAGEAVYHYCTDACYRTTDVDILSKYSGYKSVYETSYWHDDDYNQKVQELRYGRKGQYIPVNGCTSLHLEVLQNIQKRHGSHGNDPSDSYIAVYDQNERLIYQGYGYHNGSQYFVTYNEAHEFDDDGDYVGGDYTYAWGPISTLNNPLYSAEYDADTNQLIYSTNNYPFVAKPENIVTVARWFGGTTCFLSGSDYFGSIGTYYYKDIPIPSGTTGIRIVSSIEYDAYWAHSYYVAKLTGGKEKICGYTNGQIISYKPAYGGSNYVNTACSNSYQLQSGVRSGNGSLIIQSAKIGFVDSLELEGVLAPDKAAPDKVSEDTTLIEASEEVDGRVKVTWAVPKDNGTDYYHKVESYLTGSENLLCESNVTRNNLVSGIQGYYYRVDKKSAGVVTKSDTYIDSKGKGAYVTFEPQEEIVYVHLAAIDVAGNLGTTAHIKVDPRDIAWNLSTEKITITDVIGGTDYGTVYAKGDGSYYVRADGEGPFQLAFSSKMHGLARDNYQIDYQIFDSTSSDGSTQRYITKIPYSEPLTSTSPLNVSQFSRKVTGSEILTDAMNTGAGRYNKACNNSFYQSFTIPHTLHGQTIEVTPVAGATYREDVKYSVWDKDKLNSITLIADGEAPLVSGAEILEGFTEIDRDEQDIHLDLSATDDLSGVRDFKVTITNSDSMESKEYTPSADGHIRIHLTGKESIFYGDMSIEIVSIDNVGNTRVQKYRITEFAIEAWVERILPPHEPVFRQGESGILHIMTWGYADGVEVEFPQEMLEQNSELNKVYDYKNLSAYVHEERLQFMIPLYIPLSDTYTITVRAYKEGKQIDAYPDISVIEIEGSVLDEFRTRLR